MKRIKIINSKNEERTFGISYKRGFETGIQDLQGFTQSFGVQTVKERSPYQQGSTTVSLRSDSRNLSFVYNIVTTTTTHLEETVQDIIRFLSPYNGEVTIVYENGTRTLEQLRSIKAYYIQHELIENQFSSGVGSLTLDFEADSGLFEDHIGEKITLGSEEDTFIVPFTVPFTLGTISSEKIVSNSGDYYCPVVMELLGPLANITIRREVLDDDPEALDEVLTIDGINVNQHQKVVIDTTRGSESCTLIKEDGTRENVNMYVTQDSTFWQLYPGQNKIRVETTAGNIRADITFRQKYVTA